jgi:hypothetical protein
MRIPHDTQTQRGCEPNRPCIYILFHIKRLLWQGLLLLHLRVLIGSNAMDDDRSERVEVLLSILLATILAPVKWPQGRGSAIVRNDFSVRLSTSSVIIQPAALPDVDWETKFPACCVGIRTKVWGNGTSSSFALGSFAIQISKRLAQVQTHTYNSRDESRAIHFANSLRRSQPLQRISNRDSPVRRIQTLCSVR